MAEPHTICEYNHCPQCDVCAGPQEFTIAEGTAGSMRMIPAIWICPGCELFLHVPGRGWFISYADIDRRSKELLAANPDLAKQLDAAKRKAKN